MAISNFFRSCLAVSGVALLVAYIGPADSASLAPAANPAVTFQKIRNATIKVSYAGTTFLIDPMLAKKGGGILVDLPVPLEEVINVDAVIVTHTHWDHWDEEARQRLPKSMPVFAQNEADAASIRRDGFTDVRVVTESTMFKGTRLSKTGGRHGPGEGIATVSGWVFQRPGHKTTYVAGDTVWSEPVEKALAQYKPDVIILNAGYVRLGPGAAIIMGKEDLQRAYLAAPQATVIAIHLEGISLATQTRKEVRDFIAEKRLDTRRVLVPADGESFSF